MTSDASAVAPHQRKKYYADIPFKTRVLNKLRSAFISRILDDLLSRVTIGTWEGSWLSRVPPNPYQYPRPSYRLGVRDGITFLLDISDMMQWPVYFGIRDRPREALYGLASAGDVVLDVGTNFGEVLLNFARIVGPSGRVFGFEPDPASHARCVTNIGLNAFKNVVLSPIALAHEESERRLFSIDPHNKGCDRILPADTPGESIPVRTTTLDQFAQAQGLRRIDVIKVDIEGFEMNFLKGAEQSLRNHKPRLFIEVGDDKLRVNDSSAAELAGFLQKLGYTLSRAEDGIPITASFDFPDEAFDIVGMPAGAV